MYRQERNYEEAIKCYKTALRFDKDNSQILRDLALLQFQVRQLDGALETRKKIVFSRASMPFNWMSMVIAMHLSGDISHALDLYNLYLELFPAIKDVQDDHLYYKCFLLSELGQQEEVAALLAKFKKQNVTRFKELKCKLLAEIILVSSFR
jgi:tetratricopeptide (TPR) repeat protein